MKRTHQVIAGLIVLAFAAQGCGQPTPTASTLPQPTLTLTADSEPSGSLLITPPPDLDGNPQAAAAALQDPARAEQGVWFLLHGLGIGVYTGDGQQVLAGSETGPKDFWIYDFEVPLMAQMAAAPGRPFSEFLLQLNGLGLHYNQDEILKLYKDTYGVNPSAYLPGLFAATGLQFEGDSVITPLQEWLLLLDTFMPPNSTPKAGEPKAWWDDLVHMESPPISTAVIALSSWIFTKAGQAGPCGWIRGGTFTANWGLVNSKISPVDPIMAETVYYAIHGPLLARSVRGELRLDQDHAHEGHGAPGDSITFNAAVSIDYNPGGIIPIGLACGYLINLDPPLKSGELPPAKIWWSIEPEFKNHGTFADIQGHEMDGSQPTFTDQSGSTSITFQARQEPANGQGQEQSLPQTVRASFDPRVWVAYMGLNDPRLLAFLPATMNILPPVTVLLEWHEQASYELTFDSTLVTNTFTPYGGTGPVNITQQVHAVVPIHWSEEDQAYLGEAPLEYVLLDVPPILGYEGDSGLIDLCPNEITAAGGIFRVLQLTGLAGAESPEQGQTQVSGLTLIIDPGVTVESVAPVCPGPAASLTQSITFPFPTWNENFYSAHYAEAQTEKGPYTIVDWAPGSDTSLAIKIYSYTKTPVSILSTTENTTISLRQK